MNKQEYLVICMVEELSEMQKELIKILRFGKDSCTPALAETGDFSTNNENFTKELVDFFAVCNMAEAEGIIDLSAIDSQEIISKMIKEKELKVEKYLHISKNLGKVEGEI